MKTLIYIILGLFATIIPFNTIAQSNERTYRQTYADGSYADITEKSDGSSTHVYHSPCRSCKGSGRCTICHGTGRAISGWGRYQRVVPCSFCGASGQCKYCGGKGESVMVNYYDSKTQSMDGYDVNTGKKNRSVHGENSGENYYGPSNSNKSTCHNCHGTGVDPFPWKDHTAGQGLRWCYTNSEGAKCPYSAERAWHQHHRCASCNP